MEHAHSPNNCGGEEKTIFDSASRGVDQIRSHSASFPGNGAFATEAGLEARTRCGSVCWGKLRSGNFEMNRLGERSRVG